MTALRDPATEHDSGWSRQGRPGPDKPESANRLSLYRGELPTPIETADKYRAGYALAIVMGIVGVVLLVSWGAAIFLAPVTIPLLVLAVWLHPSLGVRLGVGIVAGLTLAEVAWALVYLTTGRTQPWIWLLPLLASVITVACFLAIRSRSQRPALR